MTFLSCGKLEGEFAFRFPHDDPYKKISGKLEFNRDREISWVYKFKRVASPDKVGVIILKKEVVWVDINTRTENINRNATIIYGVIRGLEEGEYKIVLTHIRKKNRIIASRKFSIYSEDSI